LKRRFSLFDRIDLKSDREAQWNAIYLVGVSKYKFGRPRSKPDSKMSDAGNRYGRVGLSGLMIHFELECIAVEANCSFDVIDNLSDPSDMSNHRKLLSVAL
jgi:hypothetical protein